MDLHYLSATELSKKLAKKELSSLEATRAVVARTKAVDEKIKAFLGYDEETTLKAAQQSDERRAKNQTLGPLDGVPVSIKNVIAMRDRPLTCGSKILEHYISPYSATVIENLQAAGAVLWGWLNMDEFAMGSSGENSAYKVTTNPWDLTRTPGGSSSGSVASVAAGETFIALGSDTGGSIRQPAALTGTVGIKPTYGRVSRYGLSALASSFDQIGPVARSVQDVAMALNVIAGHDQRDSTSSRVDVPDYVAATERPFQPLRIGIPKECFGEGLDIEIRAALETVIEYYRQRGCTIEEVSLPHTHLSIPLYYLIQTAEASSNLARFDGVRYTHRSADTSDSLDLYFKSRGEGFGPEPKRRIILGTYLLSSEHHDIYIQAQKVRTLMHNDYVSAFKKVDVLLTPTSPTAAFKIGEKCDDPLQMYLNDIYTTPANLVGIPGLAVPCGFTQNQLPIGFQLLGKPFFEAELFALAHAYEAAHNYHHQHPTL